MLPDIAKRRYNFTYIIRLKTLRWGDFHELSHRHNVFKRVLLSERARQENQGQKNMLMEAEFREIQLLALKMEGVSGPSDAINL